MSGASDKLGPNSQNRTLVDCGGSTGQDSAAQLTALAVPSLEIKEYGTFIVLLQQLKPLPSWETVFNLTMSFHPACKWTSQAWSETTEEDESSWCPHCCFQLDKLAHLTVRDPL